MKQRYFLALLLGAFSFFWVQAVPSAEYFKHLITHDFGTFKELLSQPLPSVTRPDILSLIPVLMEHVPSEHSEVVKDFLVIYQGLLDQSDLKSIFESAIKYRQEQVVYLLLMNGFQEFTKEMLYEAVRGGNETIQNMLCVAGGLNVLEKELPHAVASQGGAALNKELVSLAHVINAYKLEVGQDNKKYSFINLPDDHGNTPLDNARKRGCTANARFLASLGARAHTQATWQEWIQYSLHDFSSTLKLTTQMMSRRLCPDYSQVHVCSPQKVEQAQEKTPHDERASLIVRCTSFLRMPGLFRRTLVCGEPFKKAKLHEKRTLSLSEAAAYSQLKSEKECAVEGNKQIEDLLCSLSETISEGLLAPSLRERVTHYLDEKYEPHQRIDYRN